MESNPSFAPLKVDSWLCKSLQAVGITHPTPVQTQSLPLSLAGKNVIACAQTGSGKTACFAIPVLQKLAKDPYGVFALVLTPTRELAFQIMEQFKVFAGSNLNLRISVVIGGVDMIKQAHELSRIPHIVIATPGRLVHHLQNDHFQFKENLQNLQFLVIDEADRMLSEEPFKPDLEIILLSLPAKRQTLLFSATMVRNYDQMLSKKLIFGEANPQLEEVGAVEEQDQVTVKDLAQSLVLVPEQVKECYLVHQLRAQKLKKQQQCIVFTSTCRNAHFLSLLLTELDFNVTLLHSQLTQRQRINNLAKFKSSFSQILVATDVASRGLDIPSVHFVLNYDVPKDPKDYVHRVGRTARAGRGGSALTLVTQYDIKLIVAVEEYAKAKLTKVEVNEKEVLEDSNHIGKVKNVVRIKMSENGMEEKFEQFKEKKEAQRAVRKRDQKALAKLQ